MYRFMFWRENRHPRPIVSFVRLTKLSVLTVSILLFAHINDEVEQVAI